MHQADVLSPKASNADFTNSRCIGKKKSGNRQFTFVENIDAIRKRSDQTNDRRQMEREVIDMAYQKIQQCRVCGNRELVEVLDLGEQALTGYFPADAGEQVPSMPLKLVKCHGGDDVCHLLQLAHTYNLEEMYGESYGYRSGLNPSMVEHLSGKIEKIKGAVPLKEGELVLDIGSNDGTSLGFYPGELMRIGIDPTAEKFSRFYPKGTTLVADFFSQTVFDCISCGKKAKVITSFSMFYDLPDPVSFARDIAAALDENGVWVLEQSYMPTMLAKRSYDTVCHEHLEYYGLRQIKWIVERAGLKIVDVEFNDVNGGSFSVAVCHQNSSGQSNEKFVSQVLQQEKQFQTLEPYHHFAREVEASREQLLTRLNSIRSEGKNVAVLGASTKGNVILQYCQIDTSLVSVVAEVNSDKYGKFTPGSKVPIESEKTVLEANPDYLLVLPWHFKAFFESAEQFKDKKLIYPL